MAKVYSLRDMKREMRGDEQKACKKQGKIALKWFDLVKSTKPPEFGKVKHSKLFRTLDGNGI